MPQPIAPLPVSVPGLRVLSYGTSTAYPIGISLDRATIYGATISGADGVLYQSVNDGQTWTVVRDFGDGTIKGILELDDGEALVYIQNGSSSPGYVWRSTGWATSHTTATWALTLTTVGGYIEAIWSGHSSSFGDDTIRAGSSEWGVTNEYGGQTSASGDQTTRARRVYWTENGGATWTQVLDLHTRYAGIVNLHVHGSAYDPYDDRILVTHGDNINADGANNLQLLASDDHGATFFPVPMPAFPSGYQSTNVTVLPDAIILGSDNTPGYLRIPRAGFRKYGQLQFPAVFATNGGQLIANGAHRNRRQVGAPLLLTHVGIDGNVVPRIFASYDGAAIHELWRDQYLRAVAFQGGKTVFGPTQSGRIVGRFAQSDSVSWLLRADLVDPGPDLIPRRATFTGDGATTTFLMPHGLGVKPTRLMGWDERGTAPTVVVTADATNIVFTVSAAPANATKLQFGARYAA